jgi:hypothetical protein
LRYIWASYAAVCRGRRVSSSYGGRGQEGIGTAYASKIGSGRDAARLGDGLGGARHKPTHSWTVDTRLGKWDDHKRKSDGIDLVERYKTSLVREFEPQVPGSA